MIQDPSCSVQMDADQERTEANQVINLLKYSGSVNLSNLSQLQDSKMKIRMKRVSEIQWLELTKPRTKTETFKTI